MTSYFPPGETVELKASALDYGASGYVSDVYLIIQNNDTAGESSDNNSNKGPVNEGAQLAGTWKMSGHQEGFNNWKADLVLNSDSTSGWMETERL